MFRVECHCGNVRLAAAQSPASITECNCSICHRLGALWAYYPRSGVEVIVGGKGLHGYMWGDKTITYHRCGECGCTTHYTAQDSEVGEKLAINARMAPCSEISDIPVREFDGLNTWKYLDD